MHSMVGELTSFLLLSIGINSKNQVEMTEKWKNSNKTNASFGGVAALQ